MTMMMAKASEADLNMAMEFCNAMDALTSMWPTVPTAISKSAPEKGDEYFDCHDDEQCGEALRYLLKVAERASLMRVIWGCAVMLDPKNGCVDPDADNIEHHADTKDGRKAKEPRLLSDWRDEMGPVLWWHFPVTEAPFFGTPSTEGWKSHHTHWTPVIVPEMRTAAPAEDQALSDDAPEFG